MIKNIIKKCDMNKETEIKFFFPYSTYFIQGFINIFVAIAILTMPMILFVFLRFTYPYLSEFSYRIIFLFMLFIVTTYVIAVTYFYFDYFHEPKFKFFKKLKTYFLRKHILDKINCPKCRKNFSHYESIDPNSKLVSDFLYYCKSCQDYYSLEKDRSCKKFFRPAFFLKKLKNNK